MVCIKQPVINSTVPVWKVGKAAGWLGGLVDV